MPYSIETTETYFNAYKLELVPGTLDLLGSRKSVTQLAGAYSHAIMHSPPEEFPDFFGYPPFVVSQRFIDCWQSLGAGVRCASSTHKVRR